MTRLIVVEGNEDVKKINYELINDENYKIISFDFHAHKALKDVGIKHEIIENYFLSEDPTNLDNEAARLTSSWYQQKEIAKLLDYRGLNLGSLVVQQTIGYFFRNLKRIVGLIRLIEKEKPEKIICFSLSNLITDLGEGRKINVVAKKPPSGIESIEDSYIEIPVRLGRKTSFKIKRKNYNRIKRVLDFSTNFIFKTSADLKKIAYEKNVLLLEFNPVMYSEMLKSLSEISKNIILLNQRRPAIWNKESLKIIRNNNCKVLLLEDITTAEISQKIENDIKKLRKNLDILLRMDQVFNNVFTIEGHSYWKSIKNEFVEMVKGRFEESIKKFLLVEKLFELIKIDLVLEWAHVGMEEKIVLFHANKRKIPSIFLQHGMYLENSKFEKYQATLAFLPSNKSKNAIWGKIMKNYIINHGFSEKEIILSGSPRHDAYFKKGENPKYDNDTILIVENGFFHPSFAGSDTRSFDYLEKCIIRIFEIMKKFPNKKTMVKLHPGPLYYDISSLVRYLDPSIPIYKGENIMDLIEASDAIIALNYSTAILDAIILKKPTMLILTEKQNYEEESLVKKESTLCVTKLDDIEQGIRSVLFDELARKKLIEMGNEYLNEYFVNRGTASDFLTNIIKNTNRSLDILEEKF